MTVVRDPMEAGPKLFPVITTVSPPVVRSLEMATPEDPTTLVMLGAAYEKVGGEPPWNSASWPSTVTEKGSPEPTPAADVHVMAVCGAAFATNVQGNSKPFFPYWTTGTVPAGPKLEPAKVMVTPPVVGMPAKAPVTEVTVGDW